MKILSVLPNRSVSKLLCDLLAALVLALIVFSFYLLHKSLFLDSSLLYKNFATSCYETAFSIESICTLPGDAKFFTTVAGIDLYQLNLPNSHHNDNYKYIPVIGLVIISYLLAAKTNISVYCATHILKFFNGLNGIEICGLAIAVAFFWAKAPIIDMVAFGIFGDNLSNGINFYKITYLQNIANQYPIFPYSLASYFLVCIAAALRIAMSFLGFDIKTYHIISTLMALAYFFTVSVIVHVLRLNISKDTRWSIVLFMPFGLYYVALGQFDIFAILLISLGILLLTRGNYYLVASILACIGFVGIKTQIAIFASILIVAATFCPDQHKRIYYRFLTSFIIICVLYGVVSSFVPSYLDALSANNQLQRLSWSAMMEFFNGTVIVYRPLFLVIAFLSVPAFIIKKMLSPERFYLVLLLLLSSLVSFFQFSYAHTFGLSIFLLPGLIFIIYTASLSRVSYIYAYSLFLLAGWGTGYVGDVSNLIGLTLFSVDKLNLINIAGMSYKNMLITIEYSSYFVFGIVFLWQSILISRNIESKNNDL